MYSGFSEPSALKRRSCRRICPKRAPFGTLLKRLGQSWLVSRFASSSGTAIPQSVANGAMALPRPAQRAHVGETPAQRSSSRHGRAHEMCAPERALPPLKVPVRGRCAALAGPQLVAVERGAERAAGGTPFEPGLGENAIKPFGLRLALDALRAGNHPGRNHGTAPSRYRRRGAHVLEPAVGARSDEYPIDRDVGERHAGGEAHVGERLAVLGAPIEI